MESFSDLENKPHVTSTQLPSSPRSSSRSSPRSSPLLDAAESSLNSSYFYPVFHSYMFCAPKYLLKKL